MPRVIDSGTPLSGSTNPPLWTVECKNVSLDNPNTIAPANVVVALTSRASSGVSPFSVPIIAPDLIDYFTITGTLKGKLGDKLGLKVRHARGDELVVLTDRVLQAGMAAGTADATVTLDFETKPPDGAILISYQDGQVFPLPISMKQPQGTVLRDYSTLETQVLGAGQQPPDGFVLSGYGLETEISLPREVPAPPGSFFKRQVISDTKTQALGTVVPDGYDVDSMVDATGTITRPWSEATPQGFRQTGYVPSPARTLDDTIVVSDSDNINELINPGDVAVFVKYLNIHGAAPDVIVGQFGEQTIPGTVNYLPDGSYYMDLLFPLTPWGVQMLDAGASGNAYYSTSAGGSGAGTIQPQGIKFFAQYMGGNAVTTDFDDTASLTVAGADIGSLATKFARMPTSSEVRVFIGTVYSSQSVSAGGAAYVVKGSTRNYYRYYTFGRFRWTIFPPRARQYTIMRAPQRIFTPSTQTIVRRTNVYATIDAVYSHIVANWVRRSAIYAIRDPDLGVRNLLSERSEPVFVKSSEWLGKPAEGVWTVEVEAEPSANPVLSIPGVGVPQMRVENLSLNIVLKGNAAYQTTNLSPTIMGGITTATTTGSLRADNSDRAVIGILCGISGSRTMGVLCWYAVQRKSLTAPIFDVEVGIGTTCHVQNVNLLQRKESITYLDKDWTGMSTGGNQGQAWMINGGEHKHYPVAGAVAMELNISGNRLTFRLSGGYEKLVFQDPSIALINTFTRISRSA